MLRYTEHATVQASFTPPRQAGKVLPMRSIFHASIIVAIVVGSSVISRVAFAQGRANAEKEQVRASGTVKGFQRGIMHVVTADGDQYYVKLPDQPQYVSFVASAETDWLKPGMMVRFSARYDKKGKLDAPVRQVTVFTPGKDDQLGVFPDSAVGTQELFSSTDEKKPGAETVSYAIAGRLTSVRGKSMSVAAGRTPVKVELADTAKVSVEIADLSFLREGDKVSIDGWNYPNQKQQVYATRLTVTAAQPLGESKSKKEDDDGKEQE